MAKIVTIEHDGDAEDGEYVQKPRQRGTEAEEALYSFLQDSLTIGGEAQISIKKITGTGNAPQAHCGILPVDKYSYDGTLDYILRQWGPGDYRLYLTGPDPRKNGQRGILQNQLVSIAAPVQSARDPASDQHAELLRMLIERLDKREKEPDDEDKILDRQLKYKALFSQPSPPPQKSFMEIAAFAIPLIIQAKEAGLFAMFTPQAAAEESFGATLLNSVDKFIPVITAALQRPPAPRIIRQVAPGQRPAPNPRPVVDVKPEPKNEEKTVSNQYAHQMDLLIGAFKMGWEPRMLAEQITGALIENSPEEAALLALLNEPDPFAVLVSQNEKVAAYKDKILDLLEWLKGWAGMPCKYDAEFADDDGTEFDTEQKQAQDGATEPEQSPGTA